MGEELKFELFADEPTELLFMFTEYWCGEGDDEEMFEFAKDNDFDEIEEIEAVISEKLGDDYQVKADFIEW